MTMVRLSFMPWAITLRKRLLERMSRPLVGSSISSSEALVASAKHMTTFFFWPIERLLRLSAAGSSKPARYRSKSLRLNLG